MLKGEKIILPDKVQGKATQLAHRGAHPGQSGLARRLRYHFYFPDMDEQIRSFVRTCQGCNAFVDKKTLEPIRHHQVPSKCWDTVAIDMFGPMPSSKHVVVVHDLASHFPVAKLVSSTKADKVIPILGNIYDTFGNPATQISDNGPPFNGTKLQNFCRERDIALQYIPPRHPNSNPAETFMKPLGKAMKIAYQDKRSENEVLRDVLNSYRQTPHPATGIAPADMLFRHGVRADFPRKEISQEDISHAKHKDRKQKEANEENVNSSKYRKKSCFAVGDQVFVRNYNRRSKFDPLFETVPSMIVEINDIGNKITIRRKDNTILVRHPDDLKQCYEVEYEYAGQFEDSYADIENSWNEEIDESDPTIPVQMQDDSETIDLQVSTERPQRNRQPNRRYYNEHFVNTLVTAK